jgi:hypothetical protein
VPDERTIRLLTGLRRYYTDQADEDGDRYYIGAISAIEVLLRLLVGPPPETEEPRPMRTRRRAEDGTYPCDTCDKVYVGNSGLQSHYRVYPNHRMT